MTKPRKTLRAVAVIGISVTASVVVRSQQEATTLIRGATFRMGTSAAAIPGLKLRYNVGFPGVFEDEVPDHLVTVSDFRMDRTEVTNARFATFVAGHPEWSRSGIAPALHNGHYLEHWPDGKPLSGKTDHPVVFVTWHAAQTFCASSGGRLPTEAEWEFAARAGRDQEFPWGDEPASAERANYSASRIGDTRPVASHPANASGLYDMAGNVWEFTLDGWTSPYPPSAQVNPIAGGAVLVDVRSVQGRRVLRGGSYGGAPVNLRTRWRDSHEITNAVAFVGFRCAYPAS